MSETISGDQLARKNLIRFESLIFTRMMENYGGSTTLNELALLNYGFVCHSRGVAICVTKAANDLDIAKSTVSRILTGMRAKGIVVEEPHPTDRRRRLFRLATDCLVQGNTEFQMLIDWCREPEHKFT